MKSRLSVLRRCLQIPQGTFLSHAFGSLPKFPDPPCSPRDPFCYHVDNKCQSARDTLRYDMPYEKQLDEMQKTKPQCCVARFAHLEPCKKYERKKRSRSKEPSKPFVSMWEPPCRPKKQPFCTDELPRFDEIYYVASNKCRCYQRTWIECPLKRLCMKKVCCQHVIQKPEVRYRVINRCEKSSCDLDCDRMRRIVGLSEEIRCPTVMSPCCTKCRCPPKCYIKKVPSVCEKLKAPFPSFSETRKPSRRPLSLKECVNSTLYSQCEVFNLQRRREIFNLKNL